LTVLKNPAPQTITPNRSPDAQPPDLSLSAAGVLVLTGGSDFVGPNLATRSHLRVGSEAELARREQLLAGQRCEC
jgi:hypothetical protein